MVVVRHPLDLWHDHKAGGQGVYRQAICLRL
jgi:hypothetical protein